MWVYQRSMAIQSSSLLSMMTMRRSMKIGSLQNRMEWLTWMEKRLLMPSSSSEAAGVARGIKLKSSAKAVQWAQLSIAADREGRL